MDLRIDVSDSIGSVSAILLRPANARAGYVLAHGAGAGMRHAFMQSIAEALAKQEIATLRYQFPYTEAGERRPDPPNVTEPTVRAAVKQAALLLPGLPLVAGGKSFGGRMTSNAAAHRPLPGISGLVFLGFPLHPAKQPGVSRAAHLSAVDLPMLFLQGTRDTLAELDLITKVCTELGSRATLHIVDGADHSLSVLKRSGRTNDEVADELARAIAQWICSLG